MIFHDWCVDETLGLEMYKWCEDLFPINRSLTGNGVRETLSYIQQLIPELKIHEVPSGSVAFDWVVPDEWNISDAHIKDAFGNKLVDFKNSNLHVMGYSTAVDKVVSKSELNDHLFSLPELPEAIPYVTSYYSNNWGFCISHEDRERLPEGPFSVFIDSILKPGHMTYGELIIEGETDQEILLTTYVCHPSMANNELSGPAVLTKLAQILQTKKLKHTYRILFLVETIGSIFYISEHLEELKKNVVGGYVLTCIGDDRTYSFIPTINGSTYSDLIARHVLLSLDKTYKEYSWLDRGSDERQFNAPGVDLPIASVMRSKYGEFPEYHTSLDNLNLISPKGLSGGLNAMFRMIFILESNAVYKLNVLCEPQLGKRGLYPNVSLRENYHLVRNQMNVISFLDGSRDLLEIASLCEVTFLEAFQIVSKLQEVGLVQQIS
jgi:aminopeptidase-like protein